MEFTAADATAISQAQVQSQVQFAVARTALDSQKLQGQAAISLLQGAADLSQQGPINPGKGISVDVRG